MNFSNLNPMSFRVPALIIVFLLSIATASAQTVTAEKSMALKGIMEKMGREMQLVTQAISKEDWSAISSLAAQIASHDEPPPPEKVQILTWLGPQASKFRGFDNQSHQSANAMVQAANQKDGVGVISAFAKIQTACLGCHQTFRKDYLQHFYSKP